MVIHTPQTEGSYPQSMATTPIPIFAAETPFLTRLKLLSPPLISSSSSRYSLLIVNGRSPLNINGISDPKSSNFITNGGQLKNVISGIADQQIDELVKATQRVESAKKELAEAQEQEIEARKTMEYMNQLETRDFETVEAEDGTTTIYKNKEKLESVKAALISGIVGTLASFPISLTHVTNSYELIVSTAITISICALYGATFRYAVRRDLDDFHLKIGTCAAFGIVKGLATLDGRLCLEQEAGNVVSNALNGAVCVSENVLIFIFAAAGLDICYKIGILSPFPVESSASRTKM
ncbi:uncharacterized protein LOC111918818 [Lactuca sativa]|uniref:uncharacterized protein LOC111918818 n=1 Tax=Lactuca sativa TaxID=4236 RepID=UPI000CD87035|nr:uncharacterized protein LOC111918818 [Lactuca sativa]